MEKLIYSEKDMDNYKKEIVDDLKERFTFPPYKKEGNNNWTHKEIMEVLSKYLEGKLIYED